MNQYIIPANSKKAQLIFGLFREIDLVILGVGVSISLLLFFIVKGDGVMDMVIDLLPLAISVFLVLPVAFYHNTLVYIQEMINFFTSQNKFRWKCWCVSEQYREEESNK